MSTPISPPDPEAKPIKKQHRERESIRETTVTRIRSLGSYALAGGLASLLVSLIEFIDANFRLTPEFQSLVERAIFGAYFSLNIAGGLLIGFIVGIGVHAASLLKSTIQTVLASGKMAKPLHKVVAGVIVCAISAVLLAQQPQVYGYVLGIIREAEKIEALTSRLLNHERSTSYLMLMAFVMGAAVLSMITRTLRDSGLVLRTAWSVLMIVLIGGAYYVDSRFEPLAYLATIHRSMFLFETALSISLIATMFYRLRNGSAEPAPRSRRRKMASLAAAIALIGLVVFTFARFDRNQNLKTLLFYRTTHAKQYFRLAQWMLDLDRDGYSALLGGGDCDDLREDINPDRVEIPGDDIDQNCIGGELTQKDIEDWKLEHYSHQEPDPSAKRLNVVYLFVDALRADHLSSYGYGRRTSPNIDKLAARSFLFENAYTPAPNTFEALPRFTQGTYWDAHLEGWPGIMARDGYDAVLFPRRISTLLRHVKGMQVVQNARVRTFEESVDVAIEVLARAPTVRPFCAYLYSTDTHRPYRPHQDFYYGPSNTDLYDGEISYMDFHLGRLLDALEQSGKLKDTIIVIMADHGESLGERGVYKHSSQLYNEQTRVPMIIHLPGLSPRSIKDYVSTIDLGPTILNAVGLEYPKGCAGVSLMPLMRGEPYTHPPVYGEQTTQDVSPFVRPDQQLDPGQKKYMIITQDGFKLIYNRNYYSFELFDLSHDPGEVRNLYDLMPEKAAEMRRRLGRFIDVVTASRPADADESQYFFGPTGETREAK